MLKLLAVSTVALSLTGCGTLTSVLLDSTVPEKPQCEPSLKVIDKETLYMLEVKCYQQWRDYTVKVQALHRDIKALSNEIKDRLK